MKKLFCVILASQEDWDSPTIEHVRTTDRDTALSLALKKNGFTEEEAELMESEGDYTTSVIEVDEVIEDDGVTNEPDPEIVGCPDCGSDDIENLGYNYDTAEIDHQCKNCGYTGTKGEFLLIDDE